MIYVRSGVFLAGVGSSSVLIKGNGLPIIFEAPSSSTDFCTNVQLQSLSFTVQPGTLSSWETHTGQGNYGYFCYFLFCQNFRVSDCSFDSTTDSGAASMFCQLGFDTNIRVICTNNFFNNSLGSCTGMNGTSAYPSYGENGFYAYNTLQNFYDTGFGLWTGAHNCQIYDNTVQGFNGVNPNAVGVDVDGGNTSVISSNTFTGGQIGVRLYDSHNGAYPITGLTVTNNSISGQISNSNGNPACAIKIVHNDYAMNAQITNNNIGCVSTGIMSWFVQSGYRRSSAGR